MSDSLSGILDDLGDAAKGGENVSIGTILDAFENRSLGVFLALFGMLAAIPVIGGLPGAPLILCAFILIAIGQSVFAKGGLWAPRRLREVEIASSKLDKAVERARPWAKKVDAVVKKRLPWLASGRPAKVAITLCSVLLALSFLPLSFIPWGVLPAAMAIAAFGLALMGKDGLFASFGYALVAVTVGTALYFFL